MRKRCMDAYYYGFDATGSETIDKILGAVACAGKSYHHTENWDEEVCVYDDHTGKTPTEWIQNAAVEAAAEITRLREALTMFTMFYPFGISLELDQAFRTARAALKGKEK